MHYVATPEDGPSSMEGDGCGYVLLSFALGDAYQFDWSHEVVLLRSVTVIVKVAHVRLCHSRMLIVRAYLRETQEMVFRCAASCEDLGRLPSSRRGLRTAISGVTALPQP
jgi:hypothetical protein